MTKEEIIAILTKHIIENVIQEPGRSLNADDPLISSGLIDSFNLVDLAIMIEEKFNVRIDDTELNESTFDTLSQLASIIFARQH